MTKKLIPDDTVKSLDEYRQTRPSQLSFFELLGIENKQYSRTIELYDFIPKYHWGKKVERIHGKFLDSLEREFECRGKKYKVRVQPARIQDKTGKERDYYPSQREEVVEDALRKIACGENRASFLDDQAAVVFTLHELQQELKRTGHSYSKDQIKEALQICKRTNLTVTTENGLSVLESSIFETLCLATFEEWKEKGSDAKCFVRFNTLVTAAIRNFDIRRFDYEKAWSYKSVIARQLHKRLSHHFTQAGGNNIYSIRLTTLIRDFGLTRCAQLRDNLKEVKAALEEMKAKNVVDEYQIDPIIDIARHKKLEDAKIVLRTTCDFDMEILESNQSRKPAPAKQSRGLFPTR